MLSPILSVCQWAHGDCFTTTRIKAISVDENLNNSTTEKIVT